MTTTDAKQVSEPSRNPSLYEINIRVRLRELSRRLGRPATLDDIPDADLDSLAETGFDLIYLLGVWRTGQAGLAVLREHAVRRQAFLEVLPDLTDEDIDGACFAITGHQASSLLGGDEALLRFRHRLNERGLKLIVDFIPNHTALDHPWVETHPEYYIHGSADDLAREPQNYHAIGDAVFANGRDPYFDGWPETLQLDYSNPAVHAAMLAELIRVAETCDGLRCDKAMLILPEVFQRTWGVSAAPFWPEAIAQIKSAHPAFLFIAEVYWDLEWQLQQEGFDYTYDKRLYDRLVEGYVPAIRDHLRASLDFQERSARFLENHSELRAAATFPFDKHRAAAVTAFLCPGLRFFHEGQLEGARVRMPIHLVRRPVEPVDEEISRFYDSLLSCLHCQGVQAGFWCLVDCYPAWDGNWTDDCFIAQSWNGDDGSRFVAVVNFAPNQSQCYMPLPFADLPGGRWLLQDRLSETCYRREGDQLVSPGLYLDLPPWACHIFEVTPLT